MCSLQTASRTPLIPAWASRRPVRRVSSQQISAASASAARARGDRSPRLPTGVATRTSRPAAARSAPDAEARVRPVAELDDVADRQAPALERAGLGLDDPRRLGHGEPDPVARHADGLDDRPVRVDVGDVEREPHPDGVHPATGRSTNAPSRPSRCSSPRRRARRSAATSADASTCASLTNQPTRRAWHTPERSEPTGRPAVAPPARWLQCPAVGGVTCGAPRHHVTTFDTGGFECPEASSASG